MLQNRKACTAMGERAEQAMKCFRACSKCSTLPAGKRVEVDQMISVAENLVMNQTGQCNQM